MSLMTAAPIPSSVGRFSPLGPRGILVLDLVNGISGFAKSNQHSLGAVDTSSLFVIWSHVVPCPVAWENSSLLRSGFREQLVDILPVHQVIDPRLQIIRTPIPIIDLLR